MKLDYEEVSFWSSQPSPTYPTDRVFQPRAIPTEAQCHPPLCMWDSRVPAPLCSHCEYACPSPNRWSLPPDCSDLGPQPLPVLGTTDFWTLHSRRMLRPSPCQAASRRGRRSVLTTQPVASQVSSSVSVPSLPPRPSTSMQFVGHGCHCQDLPPMCVMCLVCDMSCAWHLLPQMEASTQPHGMSSGAFPTSAGAATHTP